MKNRFYKLIAVTLVVVLTVFNSPNNVLTLLAETISGTEVNITTETTEDYILTGSGGASLNILEGGVITGQVDMDYTEDSELKLLVAEGGILNGNVTASVEVADVASQSNVSITNLGAINGEVTLVAGSNITNSGSVTTITSNGGEVTLGGGTVTNLTANSGSVIVNGDATVTNFTTAVGASAADEQGTITVTGTLKVSGAVTGIFFDVVQSTNISTDVELQVICNDKSYTIPAGTSGTFESLTAYELSTNELAFGDIYVDYEESPTKNVTLTNTGILPIEIYLPAEFEDFNVAFTVAGVAVVDAVELVKGQVLNIAISPKLGLEIGEYEASVSLDFGGYGDSVVVSAAVIDKLVGSGSVTMDDHYYGVTSVMPQLSSTTNGIENVVVEFKTKGQPDSTYTTIAPKEVGSYVVRATFPATYEYAKCVATDEYSITYMPVPTNPTYSSGTKGNDPYYVSDVSIYAKEGYLISNTLGGQYWEALTYTSSINSVTLYFKDKLTGGMSAGYTIGGFLIDSTAPVIENIEDGGEYYGSTFDVNISDAGLRSVKVNGVQLEILDGTAIASMASGNGYRDYIIEAVDMAGNTTVMNIRVSAEWLRSGIVPEGVGVRLETSRGYTFGTGNWNVSGDTTSYAGGNTFYVGSDGDYTFTKE